MNDRNNIDDSSTTKKVKKGTILQHTGDKIVRAFFVKKGLLKSYFIDDEGKEHIFMFAPEEWLITDVNLLSNKEDSTAILCIQALEDSEIQVIPQSVFAQIDQLPTSILAEQIHKLINRICVLQKRIYLLMSSSAEDRYDDFITTYPQISQRVSLKMIASYLGLTPETLSVVRAKKKNKGI
ncbi:MAG: cAMP-binding proteins - catabolite gene activator and regulatory subunit of cAMP-dependent protein kinases [uncultured Aureispira sp.]|uniref:cAMP-binding proteins - catabolite gene activator and regulatory subunit of cAMP-dependent protein kinases n=1 Tax=uncultured Aureispira sp. TaxID=1331704 RepID=A0A6S6U940_9BACT|nr:MAG: cAMP-binding proteins - catabolite gene activator and regulatory subunit of cAMP-dependent protein kinases [uncultured Aureispira sp.]